MHNKPHTQSTKDLISLKKKGQRSNPATEFKKGGIPWNKGKKGYRLSDDHKKNIAASLIGNTRNTGKKRSEETKNELKEKWKNLVVWNKGTTGLTTANRGSFKKGEYTKDKNVNWKGGISTENEIIRGSEQGKQWKRAVILRDNFCCQRCGEQRHKRVTAHHILNFANHVELRFEVTNGITFCFDCHKLFHSIYGKKNNDLSQVLEFIGSPKIVFN